MREIKESGQFKRDLKREAKGLYRAVIGFELLEVVEILAKDQELPAKNRDHALSGDWKGFRDCHIKPDLVLIYRKPDADTLQLFRLGSHAEVGLK